MIPKPVRSALHALAKVYEQIPDAQCKGLCQASCGPLLMTELEEAILARARGGQLPDMPRAVPGANRACPLLTKEGRCSVYEQRPVICRLWGVVNHPTMRCQHGCKPRRGFLTNTQCFRLLDKVQEISRRLFGGK